MTSQCNFFVCFVFQTGLICNSIYLVATSHVLSLNSVFKKKKKKKPINHSTIAPRLLHYNYRLTWWFIITAITKCISIKKCQYIHDVREQDVRGNQMFSKWQRCNDSTKFAICISENWVACSVSSTCVMRTAGSHSQRSEWSVTRLHPANSQLTSLLTSTLLLLFLHSPSHQLVPGLAYAHYLHEQRLIPGVTAQLSEPIR